MVVKIDSHNYDSPVYYTSQNYDNYEIKSQNYEIKIQNYYKLSLNLEKKLYLNLNN